MISQNDKDAISLPWKHSHMDISKLSMTELKWTSFICIKEEITVDNKSYHRCNNVVVVICYKRHYMR